MKVSVTLDNQGLLPDKYAKFAPAEYRLEDNPVVNFPIAVSDVPAGTETLAIAFIDYDAIPVGGSHGFTGQWQTSLWVMCQKT